jgi:putative transposase
MVDVLGLALKVYVEAANSQDREGLKALAMSMKERLPRLKKIFADQGHTGECTQAVENVCGWKVEITKRSEAKVFEVQRKRWVVERTYCWFIHERRLSKDYEYWPENSESMIYVSMIRLMLRRLAPAA